MNWFGIIKREPTLVMPKISYSNVESDPCCEAAKTDILRHLDKYGKSLERTDEIMQAIEEGRIDCKNLKMFLTEYLLMSRDLTPNEYINKIISDLERIISDWMKCEDD